MSEFGVRNSEFGISNHLTKCQGRVEPTWNQLFDISATGSAACGMPMRRARSAKRRSEIAPNTETRYFPRLRNQEPRNTKRFLRFRISIDRPPRKSNRVRPVDPDKRGKCSKNLGRLSVKTSSSRRRAARNETRWSAAGTGTAISDRSQRQFPVAGTGAAFGNHTTCRLRQMKILPLKKRK